MNSRHVYIGNYYSFPTQLSKYRASAVRGLLMFFMKKFSKYREGNQYRVSAASALSCACQIERWNLRVGTDQTIYIIMSFFYFF
jgi:hypothetical protein